MRSSSRRAFLAGGLALALAPTTAARAAGWQVHDVPRSTSYDERVNGIYASSSSDAWAVGYWRQVGPLLSRWNGSQWSPVSTRLSAGSISGAAADDVWVGGLYGRTHHWDGSTWTAFQLPGAVGFYPEGDGRVVTGDPGKAWAHHLLISEDGSYTPRWVVSRWTGTAWAAVPYPQLSIADLAGAGSSLWAVGTPAPTSAVAELDPSGWWRYHRPPTDAGLTLRAAHVAAVAADDVWVSGTQVAAGSSRGAYLARWNGTTWTRVALPSGDGVPSLHDIGGTVLLERSGGTALFRWASGGWQELPASPFPAATFYAGVPGGGIWTGGSRPVGSRTVASTALYA